MHRIYPILLIIFMVQPALAEPSKPTSRVSLPELRNEMKNDSWWDFMSLPANADIYSLHPVTTDSAEQDTDKKSFSPEESFVMMNL